MKFFLFKSFTSSFYGMDTWFNYKQADIYKIGVAYHKSVKKIAQLNTWDSNHEGCLYVGVPIFRHLLARRLLSSFFRLCDSNSPCLDKFKFYFRFKSSFSKHIDTLFSNVYEVKVEENPLCALLSRINFVQQHETSSMIR